MEKKTFEVRVQLFRHSTSLMCFVLQFHGNPSRNEKQIQLVLYSQIRKFPLRHLELPAANMFWFSFGPMPISAAHQPSRD